MPRDKLLVIDGDDRAIDQMSVELSRDGFQVQCMDSQEIRTGDIRAHAPVMIIYDIAAEGLGGLDFCQRLKDDPRTRAIPQVIVSEEGEENTVVRCYELGVDAYLRKPIRARELVARIQAILRRIPSQGHLEAPSLIFHRGIEVDLTSFRVRCEGQDLAFTITEFKILRFLMSRADAILTREEILGECVGDRNSLSRRNIDVHIKSIREKLGPRRHLIETVRGVGYRFTTRD